MAIKAGINMTITYHSIEDILRCLKQKGWYCNDNGRILYTRECDNYALQVEAYKSYNVAIKFLMEQHKESHLRAVMLVKENTNRGITVFFAGENVLIISFSKNCRKKLYGKGEFVDFPWYVEEIIMPLALHFEVESCECSQIGGIFE